MTMGWTDDRVELLKNLWKKGLSASQIAEELGGDVTRNAVIGKAHRLGLSSRPSPVKKPAEEAAEPAAKPVKKAPKVEKPAPKAEPEIVTILTLTDRMCKWPLGHPGDADFRFCGRKSTPGQPYCAHHARIAYQPVQDRRRDRRLAYL